MATSIINGGEINEINKKFNVIIKSFEISDISVPASTGKQGSVNVPSISGYKCVGVIGLESDTWQCVPTKSVVNSSGVFYYALRATDATARTVTLNARLLYLPNTWTISFN